MPLTNRRCSKTECLVVQLAAYMAIEWCSPFFPPSGLTSFSRVSWQVPHPLCLYHSYPRHDFGLTTPRKPPSIPLTPSGSVVEVGLEPSEQQNSQNSSMTLGTKRAEPASNWAVSTAPQRDLRHSPRPWFWGRGEWRHNLRRTAMD